MSSSLPLRDGGILRGSLMLAVFILFGLGLAYSLIATGITGALFSEQATGSLVRVDARVVGSALVAQPFTDARYFQPRPSAAKYDLTAAPAATRPAPIPICWPVSRPRVHKWPHATASPLKPYRASC